MVVRADVKSASVTVDNGSPTVLLFLFLSSSIILSLQFQFCTPFNPRLALFFILLSLKFPLFSLASFLFVLALGQLRTPFSSPSWPRFLFFSLLVLRIGFYTPFWSYYVFFSVPTLYSFSFILPSFCPSFYIPFNSRSVIPFFLYSAMLLCLVLLSLPSIPVPLSPCSTGLSQLVSA